MITEDKLRSETAKDLAQMAKTRGVQGWHSLKKDELIKELLRVARQKAKAKQASAKVGKTSRPSPKESASAKIARAKSTASKSSLASKNPAVSKGIAVKPTAGKGKSAKSGSVVAKLAPAKVKDARDGAAKAVSTAARQTKTGTLVPAKSTGSIKPAESVKPAESTKSANTARSAKAVPAAKPTNPRIVGKIRSIQKRRAEAKDIAFFRDQLSANEEPKVDRIVLFVRDPYWLQAYWEVTKTAVERAKVALAEHWHAAEPTLRLLETHEDGVTGSNEQSVRDIKIHGGVNNWYIDVPNPPSSYRVILGYKAGNDRFHIISQSNQVKTPVPGSSDHVDHNWTDLEEHGDRVFSASSGFEVGASPTLKNVFEEKLRRPMNRSALSRYGVSGVPGQGQLEFVVDAELLIFGQTHPNAQVTIATEPVKLREDGSFTVRMSLPDRRQVLPVSSSSFDGMQIHTTVLAIERNTKVMEPMSLEPSDDF